MNSKDCIKSQLIRAVNPRKYAKSNTFVNLLGIHDQKGFSVAETDCFTIRVDKYRLTPIQGNFSLIHLQIIHCHLFQDVYRWAGRCRNYDIKRATVFSALPKISENMLRKYLVICAARTFSLA